MSKGDDPSFVIVYLFSCTNGPSRWATLNEIRYVYWVLLKKLYSLIIIIRHALYAEEETNFIYQIPVF